MSNLKPCPFCGGVAELKAPGYEYYSPCWCKCTQCGAEGSAKLSELGAEKVWNERAREDSWISVDDRLPDNQTPVLVYVPSCIEENEKYSEYVGAAYYTHSALGGYWAGTDGNIYGAIGIIHNPTYWMPLPEPPKEDEDVTHN